MINHYLRKGLLGSPILLKHVFLAIEPNARATSLDSARFNPVEVVNHLADWEPIFHTRITLAAEHPGSTLVPYDPDERAAQFGYATNDPIAGLARFEEQRVKTVELLEQYADRFDNELIHPALGSITLRDLANMIVGHDMDHYAYLSQYLRAV